jgi:hypothetical protein
MAVSFVAAATGNTGTASATSFNMTMPASSAAGDLALVLVSTERNTLLPDVPSGYTVLRQELATANHGTVLCWKTLIAGDPGSTLTITISTNRRLAGNIVVYRGVDTTGIQVVNGTYANSGVGVADFTGPSITPAVDNAMVVNALTSSYNISPWQQTFTTSSPYSQRAFDQAVSTTAGNPQSVISDKLLAGGAGSSTTGALFTSTQTQFNAWVSAVVLPATGWVVNHSVKQG